MDWEKVVLSLQLSQAFRILNMNMWNEPASATSSPAFPASLDWSDSDRVSVLFSPMRSRQLNPEAHDGKVAFWTGVIERWADSNGRTTFTIDELESELSVGERRPHCLAEVVASLEESGKVRKADEARAEWERRAAGAGAIGETLRRAGSSLLARVWGGGPPAGQVSYVFVDRVKSASEALLRDLQKVDSYDLGDLAFAVEASNVKSDSNDEEDMCVAFLRGEGLLAAGEVDGVRYLKFSGQKGRGVSVFKDTDKGVIGLRRGKAAAEERLVEAERTHAEAMQKVRHLLATGGRQRAKAMLLRAKRKEATVVRMENVVGTLEDILDKIEASRTDEQVRTRVRKRFSYEIVKRVIFCSLPATPVQPVQHLCQVQYLYHRKNL